MTEAMRYPAVGLAMQRRMDVVEFQPFQPTTEHVETLTVDLRSASIEYSTQPKFQHDFSVVPGLLGVMKLHRRMVLVTINAAEAVATLHGFPVFQVLQTEMHLPRSDLTPEESEFVELLRSAVDPNQYGRSLYFSYKLQMTLTTERQAAARKEEVEAGWKLEDSRFFWNRYLMEPITQLDGHPFVLPVIQGFVRELQGLEFKKGGRYVMGDVVLIARRSVQRLGTRNWRRGIDRQGAVANFVETEQFVSLSTAQSCSFVQIRGSIPVYWTSIPNVKYKAPTQLGSASDYTHAFDRHIDELLHAYRECVGVNLAHATGSEGKLTSAFGSAAQRYGRQKQGFRLINFDFHKECGTTRYHRLSILFDQIREDLDRFGQFSVEGDQVMSTQGGVVRTNCVDCLDRTNVVQTVFARYALESLLKRVHLMDTHGTLATSFPDVEARFKVIWADHGDEISQQYSGTGALKSGFTRTGKRTLDGLVDDGVKSVTRYYLNNFEDGRKQDALDLISGTFVIGCDTASADLQRRPDLLIYILLALLIYGLSNGYDGMMGMWFSGDQVQGSFLTCALALGVVMVLGQFVLIKNGALLVCKPKLRPDLPKQW